MFIVGRAFLFLIYDLIDKSSQRITFDNQYPYGYSIAYTPIGIKEERYGSVMKKVMEKMEWFLELGGTKRDIMFLILSGIALIISIFKMIPGLPFDTAWVAIVLCGVPIIWKR